MPALSETQHRALRMAAEGDLICSYGNEFFVAGSTDRACQRSTLESLSERGLVRAWPEFTMRGRFRITELGRKELNIMRKMPKRPPQFTELDEKALERLAWRTYEYCASDLADAYRQSYPTSPRRPHIHVVDFMDTMHSQVHNYRPLSAEVALVARDAERLETDTGLEQARDLRGDRVPEDVMMAFLNHDDKAHSWASAVVERHMRGHATRGYLYL